MNRAIHFKFGMHIEDGHPLRMDHKMTPKRGHVTKFQNFGTLITFERIELPASDLVQRWKMDPSCVQTTNDPLSGCRRDHVTFPNFGTPYNF